MRIVFIVSILCLFLFALYKEYYEGHNSYINSKPLPGDNQNILLGKLSHCVDTNLKIVKWRRSFIGGIIFLILISVLVHGGIPEYSEMFLYLFIFYTVYYSLWANFQQTVCTHVSLISKDIIRRLKKEKRI